MYYIIVYDVAQPRVNKVHKLFKNYLHWRQNSVFEGELRASQLQEILARLKSIIKENEDSIIIYEIPSRKNVKTTIIGVEKGETTLIL